MARPLQYAPRVFEALRGVFCVYKPVDRSMEGISAGIALNLARDLNNMEVRPSHDRFKVCDEQPGDHGNSTGSGLLNSDGYPQDSSSNHGNMPVLTTVPDLSDHCLVVGPRYMPEDFDMNYVGQSVLDRDASGVMVMSVGDTKLGNLASAQLLRVYHLKGQFGYATHDFSSKGKFIERTTYRHITHSKIDRMVAAMQAGHQKYMLQASQVDLQTQEAYELAVSGMMRPFSKDAGPMVYGMRCIDFNPPHFTLEVHAINETCVFLRKLVHELGLELRSTAVCPHVRRIRYGHFSLPYALLRKHWRAPQILDNIEMCRQHTELHKLIKLPKLQHTEKHSNFLPSGT